MAVAADGVIDTTTAHGKLDFGMFALMPEYEAALIQRTQAGLVAARAQQGLNILQTASRSGPSM